MASLTRSVSFVMQQPWAVGNSLLLRKNEIRERFMRVLKFILDNCLWCLNLPWCQTLNNWNNNWNYLAPSVLDISYVLRYVELVERMLVSWFEVSFFPPVGKSFWQKDSLIPHILFELWQIMIFSPVANFAQQSLYWSQFSLWFLV